jgi:hypothetical protein
MAKNPISSPGSEAGLSRIVDSLIRRLGASARDASDAPAGTEESQGSLGAEPASRRIGYGPASLGYTTPYKANAPSTTARFPRWEKHLRRWAWLRVALVTLLGVAVLEWPYGHSCGLPLLAYLGVLSFIAMTALWAGVHTWKTRVAMGHAISLALLAWGAVLAAGEILPRTGYARQEAAWACTAEAATETSVEVTPAH